MSKTGESSPAKSLSVSYCVNQPVEAMRHLLRYLPMSLAIREMMRIRSLAELNSLSLPVLDVGCGDGLFWETVCRDVGHSQDAFEGLLGIDISQSELKICSVRLSEKGGTFKIADITATVEMESIDEVKRGFNTIIANCSLEHMPDVRAALKNIRRYLATGGEILLYVPAPRWTSTLRWHRRLEKISPRLAGIYGGTLDGFFQHYHLYPHWVWSHLLQGLGYSEIQIKGLGSRITDSVFDRWLLASLPAFIMKSITGRYPRWYSWIKIRYLKKQKALLKDLQQGDFIVDDLNDPEIMEYFIRAKRG